MAKFITRIVGGSHNIAGIAGACLVSFGAWQIYEPAGFIVAGLLLLIGAILVARNAGG